MSDEVGMKLPSTSLAYRKIATPLAATSFF